MGGIVTPLRELEREGDNGRLVHAPRLAQQVEHEFHRIRAFLERHLAQLPNFTTKS